MQDLTPAILQDFFEGIKAEHTVKSLSKYRVVLNGAIDAAYKDGIIALSPMHGVKLPKRIAHSQVTGIPLTKQNRQFACWTKRTLALRLR